MSERLPLRERKRQRAREQIVKAAFELFAERSYGEVTVTDIAERAQVGRTTFFRYFGDKQEVVFADEQALLRSFADHHRALGTGTPPTLDEALRQLRTVVLAMCDEITSDTDYYLAHLRLVTENPELADRNTRKLAGYADTLVANLREQGASDLVAVLAPQLGLACYRTAQQLAGDDPTALRDAVDAAFDQLTRH
ncbi:TetR family transcriptional regulator [Saccharomonospora sp. NPDC046836]|uniref:TetR family transcriptional regulator n=1 Tax=Saccharomonospora sp. NPDC046836 TaxID=3156921 RepID=UPI0033FB8A72